MSATEARLAPPSLPQPPSQSRVSFGQPVPWYRCPPADAKVECRSCGRRSWHQTQASLIHIGRGISRCSDLANSVTGNKS